MVEIRWCKESGENAGYRIRRRSAREVPAARTNIVLQKFIHCPIRIS